MDPVASDGFVWLSFFKKQFAVPQVNLKVLKSRTIRRRKSDPIRPKALKYISSHFNVLTQVSFEKKRLYFHIVSEHIVNFTISIKCGINLTPTFK